MDVICVPPCSHSLKLFSAIGWVHSNDSFMAIQKTRVDAYKVMIVGASSSTPDVPEVQCLLPNGIWNNYVDGLYAPYALCLLHAIEWEWK